MFTDDDTAKKRVELDIANYREAAELCDKAVETVKQFDGKVFNVRFENALEKQTGKRFSVKKDNLVEGDGALTFRIEWWVDNTYITNGYNSLHTENRSIVICGIYNRTDKNIPIMNKRIVADNIVPHIENRKQELIDKSDNLEKSLNNINEWKEELQDIKEHCNKLYKEIPTEIKEYYKLRLGYTGF